VFRVGQKEGSLKRLSIACCFCSGREDSLRDETVTLECGKRFFILGSGRRGESIDFFL
jgi:hypothetical protein